LQTIDDKTMRVGSIRTRLLFQASITWQPSPTTRAWLSTASLSAKYPLLWSCSTARATYCSACTVSITPRWRCWTWVSDSFRFL